MEEFRDGNFGPIRAAAEVIKAFGTGISQEVRAVHFGTKAELVALRAERERQATRKADGLSLRKRVRHQKRIHQLDERIAAAEARASREAGSRG